MADIIQLLPDHIANQIAAGEVIHRPAAVVKELLENAIDAKATRIKLIVKDAGKTLIQVIDNGSGMSETDARMAFERHATSKISKAADLFHIFTKGFRGEALASIAAIAHVDLYTRQAHEDVGRLLVVKGSKVSKQEPTSTPVGSSFSVKNLFFNVPARRKFLKSDPVELRHILEEFKRISLAHPEIAFEMYHNDQETYVLPVSNLRQRIVGVFGKSTNDKLIPIEENIDGVVVRGFIGKADFIKKSRGDQYLFVNNRYIKSNYFNHAISQGYDELIPRDYYPFYCIFLDMDPEMIDINVHPTKTEMKFENERLIYNYIKVAVKHALGKYTLSPRIDFDSIGSDRQGKPSFAPNHDEVINEYNFNTSSKTTKSSGGGSKPHTGKSDWQTMYDILKVGQEASAPQEQLFELVPSASNTSTEQGLSKPKQEPIQIKGRYILSETNNGYIIIDQQRAHQRILYDRSIKRLEEQGQSACQKLLFPTNVHLEKTMASTLKEILPEINSLGFDVEHFGGNSFLVQGTPMDLEEGVSIAQMIEDLVSDFHAQLELKIPRNERVGKSIAYATSIRKGKRLSTLEMREIIDQLFLCETPQISPSGKKSYIKIELSDIEKMFK